MIKKKAPIIKKNHSAGRDALWIFVNCILFSFPAIVFASTAADPMKSKNGKLTYMSSYCGCEYAIG